MINKILKFIDDYSLNNKVIVVAFSGGYDSMCLLNILNEISRIKNLKLIAAHYNHNWRGEEAKREQEHCREFCVSKQIEFYTETAPDGVKKSEAVGRDLRYDFFKRTVEKYRADAVVTAHNYDDNAETILYRIVKGTGVVGLKGIAKNRDIYYRPLLDVKRVEIEEYCKANNLSPNNDSSNENTKYKRNLIRKEILPILEKINPEIKKSLTSLGCVAQEESSIVDEYLNKISEKLYSKNRIIRNEYVKLSSAVKKKILYLTLYNEGIEYDYEKVNNLYNFIEENLYLEKNSKCSVSTDTWMVMDEQYIQLVKQQADIETETSIHAEGNYSFGNIIFSIEKSEKRENTQSEEVAYVDLSGYKDLKIRTRRDGDYIYPLGLGGKMKLKKYLIQKKIPQYERNQLLLLTSNNEVLWVGGVGMSDKIKVLERPTHKISIKRKEE